jgi:hypothetical protein
MALMRIFFKNQAYVYAHCLLKLKPLLLKIFFGAISVGDQGQTLRGRLCASSCGSGLTVRIQALKQPVSSTLFFRVVRAGSWYCLISSISSLAEGKLAHRCSSL